MVGLGGAWGLGTSPGRAGSGCYAALGVAAPGFWLGGVGVIHGDPASLHGSDCCGEAVVKSWGSCPVIGLWPVKPEQAGSMVWGETCPCPGWAVEVITCQQLSLAAAEPCWSRVGGGLGWILGSSAAEDEAVSVTGDSLYRP